MADATESLYALILAGGASSRFWPLSGDEHPKYLLRVGDDSLLELAWRRARACTEAERILVVTSGAQSHAVRETLHELPARNLCVEPARRDTAAAIALGCKNVAARDAGADLLVLPADTLLEPTDALARGVSAARNAPGARDAIHVFGVKPGRPEGAFGHIQPAAEIAPGVFGVAKFIEKPGLERAREYNAAGWLWNAGCFLFSLAAFDRELRQHLPGHSTRLRPVTPEAVSEADYEGLEAVSIDYGLIEKVANLRVIRLDAAFDDVGTWDALADRLPQGQGEAISVSGSGNLAVGDALVAVVGVSNLLVVAHGGRVLVLQRGHGQQVKEAARRAEAQRE
jgi:mannose-1-phosphate guanylyltransferase